MSRLRLLPVLAALAITTAPTSLASAQQLSGAINAGVVMADFDVGTDVGAGTWLDLWAAFDWFRIGGFAGAITIPSALDARDRFAAPIGVSMAAVANLGDYDLELRARGGMWGGSTQEVKMTAGGFLGGGAFLAFHLGGGASVGAGVELWAFLGAGQALACAPTLTLTWGPPPPEHTSSPTPEFGGMAIPP